MTALDWKTERMVRKLDLTFWVAVVLIVVLGTIGSVLFKFGTNALGTIDFRRLLEIRMSTTAVLLAGLLIFSVMLFFYSGYSLGQHSFAARYLFTPIIFLALIMMAFSRFLIGVPLSMTGLGRLTGLLTALGVLTTAVASNLVFKETFSTRVLAGIALAVVAVILIGE
jgi:drug/metabolite transporter (DMT)-like permease